MLFRGDNRIQAYFAKNRPILGLGLSFGEPQGQIAPDRCLGGKKSRCNGVQWHL
jgi:hypothetical protein